MDKGQMAGGNFSDLKKGKEKSGGKTGIYIMQSIIFLGGGGGGNGPWEKKIKIVSYGKK